MVAETNRLRGCQGIKSDYVTTKLLPGDEFVRAPTMQFAYEGRHGCFKSQTVPVIDSVLAKFSTQFHPEITQ